MDIIGKRKIFFVVSGIIILVGLLSLAIQGLNLGIDFQGGALLEFSFEEQVAIPEIQELLEDYGLEGAIVQESREPGVEGILIRTADLDVEHELTAELQQDILDRYSGSKLLRSAMVGPTIGEELRRRAIYALLIASIAIIIYISFRFQFRFAVAALIALIHDVLIVVGFFSLLRLDIDTAFVAGLLTIMGYSINDSIVIFDRIRENMKYAKKESFIQLSNRAVVETLPRSINTSVTTLLAVIAVLVFGGPSIQLFMLTLLIGILAGAYSSIFVASPILVEWSLLQDKKRFAEG